MLKELLKLPGELCNPPLDKRNEKGAYMGSLVDVSLDIDVAT